MDPIDKTTRGFVAISLPQSACADLTAIVDALPSQEGVRMLPPRTWHITVRFIGDIAAHEIPALADALYPVITRHSRFQVHFERGGAFPSLRLPRAFFVGVLGDLPQFHALTREVDAAVLRFGGARDHEFVPHVTVARARTGKPGRLLDALLDTPATRSFTIDTVTLFSTELVADEFEQQLAVHTPIRRYPLAAPRTDD